VPENRLGCSVRRARSRKRHVACLVAHAADVPNLASFLQTIGVEIISRIPRPVPPPPLPLRGVSGITWALTPVEAERVAPRDYWNYSPAGVYGQARNRQP
jgi:hypothetical protein